MSDLMIVTLILSAICLIQGMTIYQLLDHYWRMKARLDETYQEVLDALEELDEFKRQREEDQD